MNVTETGRATTALNDYEQRIQFEKEEAVATERSVIAEMLQKLEGHFWYSMAKNDLKELRERVGL